jgi:hypothetical protein
VIRGSLFDGHKKHKKSERDFFVLLVFFVAEFSTGSHAGSMIYETPGAMLSPA